MNTIKIDWSALDRVELKLRDDKRKLELAAANVRVHGEALDRFERALNAKPNYRRLAMAMTAWIGVMATVAVWIAR